MAVADEKMKRKLFRWWRQGKPLGFVYHGSAEDSQVKLEFEEFELSIVLEKEKGEAPEEAIRRYFADFKNWQAIEDEWVTIDEVNLGYAWSEIVGELEWTARAFTALVKNRSDRLSSAAVDEVGPDDSAVA
jgi:hypothetical protein